MKQERLMLNAISGAIAVITVMGMSTTDAIATEPCGALGECKALIEINSSDGDIGFHFLMDGDDFARSKILNPSRERIFSTNAYGELREQRFTETFVESAEPLCFDPTTDQDPENDDEDFVTLEEFLDRWEAGMYTFIGAEGSERRLGRSKLTFHLPAAPANVMFDDVSGVISWTAGSDLGACADAAELADLVTQGILPKHPQNVAIAAWEVVFEPDVEDGDPLGALKFSIRVPGNIATKAVTVPADYLASLPADTPAKMEVGAIGNGDNATFTELDEICVNEDAGCE